ncbi:hypothetical protein HDU97_002826 [Phlyctochytrium planicorne]|nr:hypothetical protein HDU97_002826 [Phlyctochytrium planicorne]
MKFTTILAVVFAVAAAVHASPVPARGNIVKGKPAPAKLAAQPSPNAPIIKVEVINRPKFTPVF